MRRLTKFLAITAAMGTTLALTAGPAFADPPAGTTPADTAIVGTGSDTTQYLMDQISSNYDKTSPANPLYSWDAVNPDTLAIGDTIVPKVNCAGIPRPDGSSAGIDTLSGNTQPTGDTTNYCEDFGRSSRARESTDPPYAAGGVAFVEFAKDAITYALRNDADGGSNGPEGLTTADLDEIYTANSPDCPTWNEIDSSDPSNDTIDAYIPQSGSGTRSTFMTAITGISPAPNPGTCVSDLPTTKLPGGSLEENEGINKVFDNANAIFPFSIGSYQSQLFHSPFCAKTDCGSVSSTKPPCTATGTLNKFGCDEVGYLALQQIGTGTTSLPLELTGSATIAKGTGSTTFPLPSPKVKSPAASLVWSVVATPACTSGVTASVSGETLTLSGLGTLKKTTTVTCTLADGSGASGMGNTYQLDVTIKIGTAKAGTLSTEINTTFDPTFDRTLYNVVRYDTNTADHIPGSEAGAPGGIDLETVFGSSGYLCSKAEQAVITDYGFLPLVSGCGTTS
jgi:ABC-type phosphate transport system substrate-binding protein